MTDTVYAIAALWFAIGLVIEGWLARRQWRHLGRLPAGDERRVRARAYRQRRALMGWCASLEQWLRMLLWLPAGLLWLVHQPFGGAGFAGDVAFVCVFIFCDRVLRQPLPWLRWRWVERAAGMTQMRALGRARDTAREIVVATVTAALAGVSLLWPFHLWPGAIAWPVSAALLVAGAAVQLWLRPNVIAPWFNNFTTLDDGELRTRLAALMRRCAVRFDGVRVMDGSRRSNTANAYFTGFGRGKRIVLLDTLIARLTAAEVEAVAAHELGHHRCGHLRDYYAVLGLLLGFGYLGFGLLLSVPATGLSPPMAVAAIALLLPALAWPLRPLLAGWRRRFEFEADAYAVRYADAGALVRALDKLSAHNLGAASADRLYARFHHTHPSDAERLAAIRRAALDATARAAGV